MQQSVNSGVDSVCEHISELERLCNELEIRLNARDWDGLGRAINESRRAMHGFENAIADTAGLRDAQFDRAVFARLQRVYAVRDEQMKRLEAIHNGIGDRLRSISRWKQYARAVGDPQAGKRPPALFQDIR